MSLIKWQFGLIAEGTTDQAVLKNILKGLFGKDETDFLAIRPDPDATEKARTHGGWESVKRECEEWEDIQIFFEGVYSNYPEAQKILIIHLDTAEDSLQWKRPFKSKDNIQEYCKICREKIIGNIETTWYPDTKWEQYKFQLFYAICIEETEAWILPLYENENKNTAHSAKPKEKLKRLLKDYKEDTIYYDKISKILRQKKELEKCAKYNHSLELFLNSLYQILMPQD
ncbi:hypothetical protein [Thioflexithrix psekupsensis]|uniref:Uncharacterized protein n=1 Tax=Thioflexithrix psekupsensis TaxID=1570016 RepID=A0A251X5B4_9GAMM|nr:hypothetical protein [Thioflexithrix psekupsensis]OUD12127.1 hypothetical protein TPSD3_13445 [Thioflexithrix psekupsensis]